MFQELLTRIACELKASRVPYMVIGGQAVLLYGEPRLTRDIDITLGIGTDQYETILALARLLGFKILVDNPEDFVQKTKVLPFMDQKSGIRIDFIFSFSPYEKQAIERARTVTFDSASAVGVQFALLEDIVIHKVIAGRPRDIEDVKSILLKNPAFDKKYITEWLMEFDKGLDARYLDLFNRILADINAR